RPCGRHFRLAAGWAQVMTEAALVEDPRETGLGALIEAMTKALTAAVRPAERDRLPTMIGDRLRMILAVRPPPLGLLSAPGKAARATKASSGTQPGIAVCGLPGKAASRSCSFPRHRIAPVFRGSGDRVNKTWTGVSCPSLRSSRLLATS